MEKKTMKSNNFTKLMINSFKGKKNWIFLSTVILLVTTMLVPFILNADEEFFIFFGIVETFIIVFINCLIDFNFLHNDSKLAYYKSKPITMEKQITIHIVSNIILTGYLFLLLTMSIILQNVNYEIFEAFKFIIPWILAGIFLSALSSVLTGNTIMAGIMTIFNFALPGIFYVILFFVFTILENIVIGFSANILMDEFTRTFYKLDYLYFFIYTDKSIDAIYFIVLASVLVFITLILKRCISKRKNENTGNFMVFDGYKYFVSVLASLIVPAGFSIMSYNNNIVSKIFVSLILSMLSYYIIIAVLEKTFRISKYSIKLYTIFMIIFIVVTGGTVGVANHFKNYVPNPEEVNMAYIGNTGAYNQYLRDLENESEDVIDNHMNNIILLSEKESIQNITELHHELIEDQTYNIGEYYYLNSVVISYWMNDGRLIVRDYKITGVENNNYINDRKDEIANNIINSNELKQKLYDYLYDESYYEKNIYINIRNSGYELIAERIDINDLRDVLIKDINNYMIEKENAFEFILFLGNKFLYEKTRGDYYIAEVIQRENGVDYSIDEIYLDKEFVNTIEYLNLN